MLRRIKDLFRFFLPENTSSRYLDFTVYHHKDDSLLRMVRQSPNGIYEMEERDIMTSILKKVKDPLMLDIGANIGLMSLNIVSQVKTAKVYAFEPGPNQFAFLKRNIEGNNLADRVHIANVALGSNVGVIDFFIHHTKDSSGDGLRDTGRAGKGSTIQVPSMTLDSWWHSAGEPKVNLIKLDTEGSELPILRSATDLINRCNPPILIEICYLNFEKYGFTFQQHLDFFNELSYEVLDLKTNERITKPSDARENVFYFLALPKQRV